MKKTDAKEVIKLIKIWAKSTGQDLWDLSVIANNCIFVAAKRNTKITDAHIQKLLNYFIQLDRRFHLVWGCHGKEDGSVYFW